MSPARITGFFLLLLVLLLFVIGAAPALVDLLGTWPANLIVASPGEGMPPRGEGAAESVSPEGSAFDVSLYNGYVDLSSSPPVTAPQVGSEPSAAAPPAPEVPASPPEVAAEPSGESEAIQEVRFMDGRLSVRLENALLGSVLDEISREAMIAVILGDGVSGQRISVEFLDLPLDEGLRRILKEQDAFYYHRGGASVKAVWVYPRDEGRGLYPVPPEDWASTADLEQGLADPDPEERARAIETYTGRTGDRARDAVLQALKDESDTVRTSALYGALNQGIEVPAEILSGLALNDSSVSVRFLALEGLADHPNLDLVAVDALDDPDPVIRDHAQSILDQLDWAAGLLKPRPPAQ